MVCIKGCKHISVKPSEPVAAGGSRTHRPYRREQRHKADGDYEIEEVLGVVKLARCLLKWRLAFFGFQSALRSLRNDLAFVN